MGVFSYVGRLKQTLERYIARKYDKFNELLLEQGRNYRFRSDSGKWILVIKKNDIGLIMLYDYKINISWI